MYDIKFIQKDNCKDGSDHLFTFIYKFFCTDTKLHYIIRAEYHRENVFAIKFYCKKDKRSKYKYNKIINKNKYSTVLKIFQTCLAIIPQLLSQYPNCNFAILSSRSIDFSNPKKLTENLQKNQRFRIYTKFLQDRIGNKTFTHFQYQKYSSYLLLNNEETDIDSKEFKIKEMFENTYEIIPDVADL